MRHFEVIRVKSKWHQAKEGKPCTAYTTALNMKAAFSPNALISWTTIFVIKGNFQKKKKKNQNENSTSPSSPLYICKCTKINKLYPPSCWTNSTIRHLFQILGVFCQPEILIFILLIWMYSCSGCTLCHTLSKDLKSNLNQGIIYISVQHYPPGTHKHIIPRRTHPEWECYIPACTSKAFFKTCLLL